MTLPLVERISTRAEVIVRVERRKDVVVGNEAICWEGQILDRNSQRLVHSHAPTR